MFPVVYTHTHTHARTYTRTHARTYTHTHTHTHTHTRTHTPFTPTLTIAREGSIRHCRGHSRLYLTRGMNTIINTLTHEYHCHCAVLLYSGNLRKKTFTNCLVVLPKDATPTKLQKFCPSTVSCYATSHEHCQLVLLSCCPPPSICSLSVLLTCYCVYAGAQVPGRRRLLWERV